jgi:hypothetical protein
MQLNATQIAAIYGVRPQRVGGTRNDGLSYSNQTQDQLDELQNTLRPWLNRWEHLLTAMLPATQYARFDADAFLKTDPKTRNDIYQVQRNIGTRTVNEIRNDDDKLPLEGGDDAMALPVVERLVSTTRAIPNSILPMVTLEADRIAKMLEHMAQLGLTNPVAEQTPPIGKSAESYLGGLLTQVRSGELFGPPGGEAQDSDRKAAITMLNAYADLGTITSEQAMRAVAKAREAETAGELAALFDGLPPMHDGVAPSAPRPESTRQSFGDPDIRCSDSDRANARKVLAYHAGEGRLRPHELDERSRKAGEAVTCGNLATLFADLPAVPLERVLAGENRSGGKPSLFGPAAKIVLLQRDINQAAGPAALNGKAH